MMTSLAGGDDMTCGCDGIMVAGTAYGRDGCAVVRTAGVDCGLTGLAGLAGSEVKFAEKRELAKTAGAVEWPDLISAGGMGAATTRSEDGGGVKRNLPGEYAVAMKSIWFFCACRRQHSTHGMSKNINNANKPVPGGAGGLVSGNGAATAGAAAGAAATSPATAGAATTSPAGDASAGSSGIPADTVESAGGTNSGATAAGIPVEVAKVPPVSFGTPA